MLSLGRPGAGGQREQQAASPAPGVVSPAPPRLLLVFSLKLSAVVDFAVNIFKTFFYNGKVNKAEYRNEPPSYLSPSFNKRHRSLVCTSVLKSLLGFDAILVSLSSPTLAPGLRIFFSLVFK